MTDTSNTSVRTRFAPSPTGSLHMGSLRTVLWCWLFTRHHGGKFILRIEDTDQKRYNPTSLQEMMEALRWAGVDWDEGPDIGGEYGPYVQSERLELYQQWGKWLVDNGHAYHCYCSEARLEQVNQEKIARKEATGYDRRCRDLSPEQTEMLAAECAAEGRHPVIRLRFPLEGQTSFTDDIRGEVTFENNLQQDSVLLKSDGFPTYHLAVVVDDHFMQISHVVRAIEWLPSLPLHIQLWKAFGWPIPHYAHVPVILNPDGKGKLSKRKPPLDKQGNPMPIMVHDYMRGGYLPEATDNFVINMGWNYGDDVEVYSLDEAMARFEDFSRISASNSAYPAEKLEWYNALYIRERITADDLANRLRPVLEAAGYTVNNETLHKLAPILQTRLKTLNDVVAMAGFFFAPEFTPPAPEQVIQKKMDAASTKRALEASLEVLEGISEGDFVTQTLYDAVKPLTETLGLSNSQLFGVLRVAVTGQTISPPTFESMEVLGKAESVKRIKTVITLL